MTNDYLACSFEKRKGSDTLHSISIIKLNLFGTPKVYFYSWENEDKHDLNFGFVVINTICWWI